MARIRTVKPELWSDESLSQAHLPARLLFIGILNLCDDYGICRGNVKWIKSQIFPYDDNIRITEVSQWIDQLVKARMLVPFKIEDEGYLYVRTFSIHQRIDKPSKNGIISAEKLQRALKLQKVPEDFAEYSENIPQLLAEYSESDTGVLPVGKERKGKEREGERTGDKSPQHPPEVIERFNSFQQWIQEYAPNVSKMKEPITIDQFLKLKEQFSSERIMEFLKKMHNWKPLLKKNNSAYLTLINWSKNGFNTEEPTKGKTVSNHREEDGRRILEESFS